MQYQAPMSFTENDIHFSCEKLWTQRNAERFKKLVQAEYGYYLTIDGLPAALKSDKEGEENEYNKPIPLGYKSD